jgi:hypothetical protein
MRACLTGLGYFVMAILCSIEANAIVLECVYEPSEHMPRTVLVHDVSKEKGWEISDTTFSCKRRTEKGVVAILISRLSGASSIHYISPHIERSLSGNCSVVDKEKRKF